MGTQPPATGGYCQVTSGVTSDENDFVGHCIQRRKYPVLLKMEFNNAVRENSQHSLRHGSKKTNMEKNQNPRIIPYDFNRVVLEPEADIADSDYINASYVDSLVQ